MEIFKDLPYDIQFKIYKKFNDENGKNNYFKKIKFILDLLGRTRLSSNNKKIIIKHRFFVKNLVSEDLVYKIIMCYPEYKRDEILYIMKNAMFKYTVNFNKDFNLSFYRELMILSLLLDEKTIKNLIKENDETEQLKIIYRFIKFSDIYL